MHRPDVEDEILDLLERNKRLSLGDIISRAEYNGSEVRKAFKYLLEEREVVVEGMDGGQKLYERN